MLLNEDRITLTMELIFEVELTLIHIIVALLIFPLEKSLTLVAFVVLSLKLVIL